MARASASTNLTPPDSQRAAIHGAVLEWYRHQQRDLPWRRTRDPYAILVAEVMLQQTQVERVLPKYRAFLDLFPTVETLGAASTADVIRAWSGMGYNVRAVRLQQVARRVTTEHGGRFPRDLKTLLTLPGVGPYTARAILCFAFDDRVPVVDTNVRRVLGRLYRDTLGSGLSDRLLLDFAEAALPDDRSYEWNQALMDLGATVCASSKPLCLLCPASAHCDAQRTGALTLEGSRAESSRTQREQRFGSQAPFLGSTRYYRGRIVAALRVIGPDQALDFTELGPALKEDFGDDDLPWLDGLVAGLERDGLAVRAFGTPAGVRLPT